MVNVWMQISTVTNHKGREPPVTCQKFGSGVVHTLISRQEVYGTERKWSETERKWNEMERKWSETERKWSEMELK